MASIRLQMTSYYNLIMLFCHLVDLKLEVIMAGFFNLKSPSDLFNKAKWDYKQFLNNRSGDESDYALFNLVATLTHLREWIYPHGYQNLDQSKESIFFEKLFNDSDFKDIQSMCNSGKHFQSNFKMTHLTGFRAGSRAGEPLDVRNHYHEDELVLKKIDRVISLYREFLEEN